VQALEDLTYERRKEFLRQQHPLPQESGGSNRIIPHEARITPVIKMQSCRYTGDLDIHV